MLLMLLLCYETSVVSVDGSRKESQHGMEGFWKRGLRRLQRGPEPTEGVSEKVSGGVAEGVAEGVSEGVISGFDGVFVLIHVPAQMTVASPSL